jgi:hypothetical protein
MLAHRALFAAIGLLATAAPVAAQINTLVSDNPLEEARIHLRPFHFTPDV